MLYDHVKSAVKLIYITIHEL